MQLVRSSNLSTEVIDHHGNDHALGKALDEIAAYGSSKLYGEVAFEIAMEQALLGPRAHHDSTSFVVHGEYADDSTEQMVEVTHGYSKDHRPDLKQVMMALTMTGLNQATNHLTSVFFRISFSVCFLSPAYDS